MCSDTAIRAERLSKCYHLYDKPRDRLLQGLLRGRRKFFRELWAVRDVSFEIRKGETFGIIGRNGSGKSTLLQMMCGTLTPTHGSVSVRGRTAALLELGAGFNPEFTGRENVYMNCAILGMSRRQTDSKMGDIVRFSELGDFLDQPVKTYSSGMYVRLAFSVAIHTDPDVLVIDEALAVGDEAFQRKCYSKIADIRANGATIVFVSHSGDTVVQLCDRALLMDRGECLLIGKPKSVVSLYQKMIYAPEGQAQALREQYKTMGEVWADEAGTQEFSTARSGDGTFAHHFDPQVLPTSTVVYENQDAKLEIPYLSTIDGERINVLQRRGRYVYNYTVRFMKSARNVYFGMHIKTIAGIELGGAVSSRGQGIERIEAGEVLNVRFGFHCNLLPGTYFMNAGVMGRTEGEIGYLARIVDAVMFRVQFDSEYHATGIVDFLPEPEISVQRKNGDELLVVRR